MQARDLGDQIVDRLVELIKNSGCAGGNLYSLGTEYPGVNAVCVEGYEGTDGLIAEASGNVLREALRRDVLGADDTLSGSLGGILLNAGIASAYCGVQPSRQLVAKTFDLR